jgi:hypothetical protein
VVTQLVARSISRSVRIGSLSKGGSAWRVLAAFDRACDLVTASDAVPGGDGVIALVLPEIGDGPLNIVVEGRPGDFALAEPGMAARLAGTQLHIGELSVALSQAETWEPQPSWELLRRNRARIENRLPLVETLALASASSGSLLNPDLTGFVKPVRSGLPDLAAGWAGDPARLRTGAERLAGLGSGLTPAGDDFLAGLMLGAWLAHPQPVPFCRAMLEAAAPRTTTLSAAMLRATARGECSAAWQALLAALAGRDHDLAAEVGRVLAYGHTSGADTLAGFLWTLLPGSLQR